MSDAPQSHLILYRTPDGQTRIQCRFENENVWLTQALMAELFQAGGRFNARCDTTISKPFSRSDIASAHDKPLYQNKCVALFEHIYESCPERDAGVYAMSG
jgi:hypothetical protein